MKTKMILRSFVLALVIFGVGVGAFFLWEFVRRPTLRPLEGEDAERRAVFQKLVEAKALAGEGKHAEARVIFEALMASENGSVYGWDAQIGAAASVAGEGKLDEALERIVKFVRTCPFDDQIPRAHMIEADIHSLSGRHDQARLVVDQIIIDNPNAQRTCANALLTMCRIYERIGKLAPSRAALLRIADDYPCAENTGRNLALRLLESVLDEARALQAPIIAKLEEAGIAQPPPLSEGTTTWRADDGPYLVAEALNVGPGSTLQIEAGTHVQFAMEGQIRVDGTLLAEGTADEPVRFTPLQDDPERHWWVGIVAPKSDAQPTVRLTHCQIVGAHAGVQADAGVVELANCTFDRSHRAGVLSSGNTKVHLLDSQIVSSHRVGVECTARTDLMMEACRVRDAKSHGMFLREVADTTRVRQTIVESCPGVGVLVRGHTSPVIEGCTIRQNGGHGVRSIDGASASVTDCLISENHGAGVQCEKDWNGSIARNRIQSNQGGGVALDTRCGGMIEDNLIELNALFGVRLRLISTPALTGNRLVRNDGPGLWLKQDSLPAPLGQNQFLQNAQSGLLNEGPTAVNAAYNWWGTTDDVQIAEAVQDRDDNDQWGQVKYEPPLSEAPQVTVAE